MKIAAPFLQDAKLQKIFAVIAAAGGEARMVGGAVRNAILNVPVTDIDLGTTLLPDQMMSAFTSAGVKTVPTGLAHGTVTIVIDHQPFEITTLRRDVETDGRHATVAFTDDWAADAERRDFTMNALSADAAGHVYDYTGGIADALARRVRFVGDPATRIREDYLRILRFYRFYAQYGAGGLDATARVACRDLRAGLAQLSAERIQQELKKLLRADNYVAAVKMLTEDGMLQDILPQLSAIDRVSAHAAREKDYYPSSWLARLVTWCGGSFQAAFDTAERLKFSNADTDYLKHLAIVYDIVVVRPLSEILYQHKINLVKDALLLNQKADVAVAMSVIENWQQSVFPLSGHDLIALGVSPGPQLGQILKTVEAWWIQCDFTPDRAACLAKVEELGIGT